MSSDGMGVGVMLEVARVLIERNEPINGSVIFSEFPFACLTGTK
jgi:Zn-dependent M28 family amino/carboxypeptidase